MPEAVDIQMAVAEVAFPPLVRVVVLVIAEQPVEAEEIVMRPQAPSPMAAEQHPAIALTPICARAARREAVP